MDGNNTDFTFSEQLLLNATQNTLKLVVPL